MKLIASKFSTLLILMISIMAICFCLFTAELREVSAQEEPTRISAINNAKTMEGTPATDIVPVNEGHDDTACNGGISKSVVCNQLGWRPFPEPLDLSGFDKDNVTFDLWMYLSDRQGLDGVAYSPNNIGFAFANDISSWDDRKYIPWFPTRAQYDAMGDGWNHVSVKLSLLPQDRVGQFENLDMSSIYIYVLCTTIDDLYIHDVYFTENAEQNTEVKVYYSQGFTDEDRPKPKTMTLDTDSVTLEVDDTYSLQTSVRPYSSKPEMRFVSDAPSVATVSANGGVITGVSEGECVITAKVINVEPNIIAKVKVTVKESIPINPQNKHEINVDSRREAAFSPDYFTDNGLVIGSSGIFDFAPEGDGKTIFAHYYLETTGVGQSAGSLDYFNIKSYNLKHVVLQFNMFIADKTNLGYEENYNKDTITYNEIKNLYSGFRLSPPTSLNWVTDYYIAPITKDMYDEIISGWNRITISFSYFEKVGNPSAAGLSFLVTQNKLTGKDYEIGFNDISVYEGTVNSDSGYTVEPLLAYKAADGIEITGANTLAKGRSMQLSATVSPSDCTMANYYVFESSDTSVATVTRGGLVSAKGTGQVTITAKTLDGLTKQTFSLTVTDTAVTPTAINVSGVPKKAAVGDTFNLSASFEPANVDDGEVIYYSDNVSVAVVDENGKVTVVGDGIAHLTVYSLSDTSIKTSITIKTQGYQSAQTGKTVAIVLGSVGGVAIIGAGSAVLIIRKRKAANKAEVTNNADEQ